VTGAQTDDRRRDDRRHALRRLSRIPLRRRLVAGFAATMLVLLTAAGAFVYWRVQFALDRSLNRDLDGAAATLAPMVTATGQLPADSATLARIDGFQVLDASGNVLDHDPKLAATPALTPGQLRAATISPIRRDTGELLPVTRRPLRLYATPVRVKTSPGSPPRRLVLLIAIRRDQHDEALRELLLQLTAAGLGTLVLTSVVGDLLARAALRPVETYRRRAADIAASATDIAAGGAELRLEVPPGRDDEITRLGHTLNDMLTALSAALERERRFINDASHELRTPLTLLTSRVQLMLSRPRTVEQHQAALTEMTEDLARMTRMADDLLQLGTRRGHQDSHEPHDLTAEAAAATRARTDLVSPGAFYSRPGALRVASTGPVLVDVDAVVLRRVLDNLLDNAALHGAPPVEVTVDCVERWARLQVSDAGAGMPPELLATATERFARSAEARTRPGSGLGLSLVAALVSAAGGQLRLCYAGRHRSVGAQVPISCTHGDAMTVTVLLPSAPTAPTAPSD
jgi:two-component system, OmpR family, sensor kinase